ncbi:MAG: hypothetical protein R6X25_07795 [Candidatus Krumholzibacteriia bacterium]
MPRPRRLPADPVPRGSLRIVACAAFAAIVLAATAAGAQDGSFIRLARILDGPCVSTARLDDVAVAAMGDQVVFVDISRPEWPVELGRLQLRRPVRWLQAHAPHVYVLSDTGMLDVVDASDPTRPVIVGRMRELGSPNRFVQRGARAYLADFNFGVRLVDVADPAYPAEVGALQLPSFASDVALAGTLALIVGPRLDVVDMKFPDLPEPVAELDTGDFLQLVAADGYLALAAGGADLRVVDLSRPTAPMVVGTWPLGSRPAALAMENDLGYASLEDGSILVLDLSDPAAPGLARQLTVPRTCVDLRPGGSPALAACGSAGLRLLDLAAEPPQTLGHLPAGGLCRDVAVTARRALVARGTSGLAVLDITVADQPLLLGELATPGELVRVMWAEVSGAAGSDDAFGAADQGFLPAEAPGTEPGPELAYLADLAGGLHTVAVADDGTPVLLATWLSSGGESVFAAAAGGGHLYVAMVNSPQVAVLSLADPAAPAEVGRITVSGPVRSVTTDQGVLLVATSHPESAVHVFGLDDPAAPVPVGKHPTGGPPYVLAASDQRALVRVSPEGTDLLSLEDPAAPRLLSTLPLPTAQDAVLAGATAYVAAGAAGISAWDLGDPASPVRISAYLTHGHAYGLALRRNDLLVADYEAGVWIMHAPAAPTAAPPSAPGPTLQAAPNPFNPLVTLSAHLSRGGPVRLEVLDLRGRRMAVLLEESREAGELSATWDGRSDAGEACPSGTYVARLIHPGGRATTKLLLVR